MAIIGVRGTGNIPNKPALLWHFRRFQAVKGDAYKVHAVVRILFAQPVIKYLIPHELLSF
jgi:hypothetical protein